MSEAKGADYYHFVGGRRHYNAWRQFKASLASPPGRQAAVEVCREARVHEPSRPIRRGCSQTWREQKHRLPRRAVPRPLASRAQSPEGAVPRQAEARPPGGGRDDNKQNVRQRKRSI